jgi:hypothetical protein
MMKDALNSVAKATNTPIVVTTYGRDGEPDKVETVDQIDELIPNLTSPEAEDETEENIPESKEEAPTLSEDKSE